MSVPDEQSFARECQVERTPLQLKRWADEQLKQIGSTQVGKSAIRLRRGIAKQFIEEVYPLGLWASRVYGDRQDIRCKPVLGNQSYDAVITDCATTPHREFRIEITQAMEGYDDHLRMEYMERHGGVSMIGKPQRSGTRADRKIDVPFEAAGHGTLIGRAEEQVRSALANKAVKAYAPNTSLLVMMEDAYYEWDGDFSDLDALLLDWAKSGQSQFDAVYVLGWHGKVAVAASVANGTWTIRRL
ncbi:MAG TPA: hypothetical protein VHS31_12075 [Tepidisphaeraceae bacterium]|jgi:hypothetical protein|nr:hypothetical protein [Tepidisphaeraceae bacterium]